jgi:uncharacterized protein with von Willebrand factor type A (vWA) domain
MLVGGAWHAAGHWRKPVGASLATAGAGGSWTDLPTPTHTTAPSPLYLPIVVSEHCDPVHERSDVALVMDTSSSMTGSKIADAKAAALALVSLIDLAPGRSHVSVVR